MSELLSQLEFVYKIVLLMFFLGGHLEQANTSKQKIDSIKKINCPITEMSTLASHNDLGKL